MPRGRRPQSEASIPSVGKICIGEKAGGNGRPTSLDFFKPTGKYAEMFTQAYGEKPTKLTVVFLYDDHRSCTEEVIWRNGKGKIMGKYDYESCQWWNDQVQDYVPVDKEWAFSTAAGSSGQITEKRMLTLSFMLPRLNGLRGLWRVTTQGEKSSIEGVTKAFYDVLDSAQSVIGIPFELSVEMCHSQAPSNYARKFPVLTLVSNLSLENIETIRGYVEAGNNLNRLGILDQTKIQQIGMAQDHGVQQIGHLESSAEVIG